MLSFVNFIKESYTSDLISDLRSRIAKRKSPSNPDIWYSLGMRTHDPKVFEMAEFVENVSDRESMLQVLDSMLKWNIDINTPLEWSAAQELGANHTSPKIQKIPVSSNLLTAFKARQSFLQRTFASKYGSDFVLFRGIKKNLSVETSNEIKIYGLSSWALNRQTASNFVGRKGRLLKAEFQTKDIWLTDMVMPHRIVHFNDDHGEVVIKWSNKTIAVIE